MEEQPLFGESYHSMFNPKIYLKEYYGDVKDNHTITSPMKPVYDFYKSLDATRFGSGGLKVLDLGCGPVIANVISAAEFASEIILAEYTELSCKEITKWLDKDLDAHDWTPFFTYIVTEVEGRSSEEIAVREEKLRSAIKAVVPCDLTKDPILSSEYMQEYDVVQAFLSLEPASSSKEEYLSILKRVRLLVKPGGTFILYSVQRSEELPGPGVYEVKGVQFSDLRVSVEFVKSSLRSAGFNSIQTLPLALEDEDTKDISTFTLFYCQ